MTEVDRIFRQLAYRHGFSLASSKKITDLQILKKPAVYDVEKMRTIQLMPAAFNMNNKNWQRVYGKNGGTKFNTNRTRRLKERTQVQSDCFKQGNK